jgi:hypothetical protein
MVSSKVLFANEPTGKHDSNSLKEVFTLTVQVESRR